MNILSGSYVVCEGSKCAVLIMEREYKFKWDYIKKPLMTDR